jgi:hypothetical protein
MEIVLIEKPLGPKFYFESNPSLTIGAILAHDIVNHQNGISKIGSISDEAEAFGGMIYQYGSFNDKEALLQVFYNICVEWTFRGGKYPLPNRLNSFPITDMDKEIKEFIAQSKEFKGWQTTKVTEDFETKALDIAYGYLHLGVYKASKRLSQEDTNKLYKNLNQLDNTHKRGNPGNKLLLTIEGTDCFLTQM